MSNLQCLLGVLLNEQDGGASPVDLLDDRENLIDQHRWQTHRRLTHQRPANREHLLLATGQRSACLPLPLCQPRKKVIDLSEIFREVTTARVCTHMEVLYHRHAGEDAATFRCLTDAG